MNKIQNNMNKEVVLYIIFGVLTTIINIVVYVICSELFMLGTAVPNIIAWILSVLFAYLTNKKFVFESRTNGFIPVIKECVSFFAGRIATLIIETGFLLITVNLLSWPNLIMKTLITIIVVVLNYVISKLMIFKKRSGDNEY